MLITIPKGNVYIFPWKRKCSLCHKYGAYAHGSFPRYPPGGGCVVSLTMILVPRFLCLHCSRTFSLLPFFLVRRISMPLPMLLFLAQTKRTWGSLLDVLGIARNTLWSWKLLGMGLLAQILEVLKLSRVTWRTLSLHLSRWQYPGNLRKPVPTIP